MDKHMIDNEAQRENRKIMMTPEQEDAMVKSEPRSRFMPNRKNRRRIAKQKGIFKHRAWAQVNKHGIKMSPQTSDSEDKLTNPTTEGKSRQSK